MLRAGNYFPENTVEFLPNQAESRTFGPFYGISTVLNHFQSFLATCCWLLWLLVAGSFCSLLLMLQEMKFWLSRPQTHTDFLHHKQK
jgi:hypothetical protein